MSSQSESRVAELITPIVEDEGLYLDSVKLTPAGKRTRVVIALDADSDDALDLDTVASVSRSISEKLDEEDPVSGAYVLEVTSPGVDRPLTLPRHWCRAKGRLVSIRLNSDSEISGTQVNGESEIRGRVIESSDTAVTLKANPDTLEIPLSDIAKATVEIEFNRK